MGLKRHNLPLDVETDDESLADLLVGLVYKSLADSSMKL